MNAADRTISLPTLLSTHGRRSLADAHAHGWTLCSYASPVDDACEGLTAEQAAGIAAEDAGLIYARAPGWLAEGSRVVAGRGPDREHGRIASIDWATAVAVVAWDQGTTTSASVLEIEADGDQPAAITNTTNFVGLHTEIARRLVALHTTPYALHQRPLVEQPPLTAEAVVAIDAISAELSAGAAAVRVAVFARVASGDVEATPAERAELGALHTACLERLAVALGAESAHHLVMRSEARLLRGGPASIEQAAAELRALALAEELAWHVVDRLRAELAAREAELRARAVDLRLCASLGLVVDDPSAPPAFRDAILEALRGPAPQVRVLEIFEPHVAAAAAADGSLYQVEAARLAALRSGIALLARGGDQQVRFAAWETAIAAQLGLQQRYAHLAG